MYFSGCCCCYMTFTYMFGSSGNDKPDKPVSDVSINVGAPAIEQSDTQIASQTEIKVGTPAVEQSDAWTAYKTETGPVFYYNAVTGISTCEKPVGFEGEVCTITSLI